MDSAPIFGVLAVMIGVAGMTPYIVDTVRGRTTPVRTTWLLWTTLAALATSAQLADGASWSALPIAIHAVLNGLVYVLALRRPSPRRPKGQWALLGLAALGLTGWIVSEAPIVATVSVICVDLVGLILMTPKVLRDPESETLVTFVTAAIGGALTISATGGDSTLLVYPVYYFVANGLMAALIGWRRSRGRPHLQFQARAVKAQAP